MIFPQITAIKYGIGAGLLALAFIGGCEWEQGKQAQRDNAEIVALQKYIKETEERVTNADESLQNAKRGIDNRAKSINGRVRVISAACPSTSTPDGGDDGAARNEWIREIEGRVNGIRESIVDIGRSHDECVAKRGALIEAIK